MDGVLPAGERAAADTPAGADTPAAEVMVVVAAAALAGVVLPAAAAAAADGRAVKGRVNPPLSSSESFSPWGKML